jgi:hypothetical protein
MSSRNVKKVRLTRLTAASTSNKIGEGKLKKVPKLDLMMKETITHSHDVKLLGRLFVNEMLRDINTHDYTKLLYKEKFQDNFRHVIERNKPFKEHEWWNIHINKEPHHAFDYTGEVDINLGHIIHMLVDWICAGKTRDKESKFKNEDRFDEEFIKERLYEAYKNTLSWLDDHSTV